MHHSPNLPAGGEGGETRIFITIENINSICGNLFCTLTPRSDLLRVGVRQLADREERRYGVCRANCLSKLLFDNQMVVGVPAIMSFTTPAGLVRLVLRSSIIIGFSILYPAGYRVNFF